jgi:hypothetical protein
MATFLHHESCPKCGSRDNLARYSDGSAWCFGCHLLVRPGDSGAIHRNETHSQLKEEYVSLQPDLCFDYPGYVVSWLARYGISVGEAIKHGWKYSPYWDQLVFIFNDEDGNPACVQARNFRKGAKTKYYNQGSPGEVLPIFGREDDSGSVGHLDSSRKPEHLVGSLVVVEDAVSAARIAPSCPSMPCLGSYLPSHKLMALKRLKFTKLITWLDSDKLKESREIAQRAKWLGFTTKVVYTELDPKCHTDEEIMRIISN